MPLTTDQIEELEGLELPLVLGNGYTLEEALLGKLVLVYKGEELPRQISAVLRSNIDECLKVVVEIGILVRHQHHEHQRKAS